jgi:hypothetical protein
LVDTATRTSNNIYVLSEIGNEKFYLEKEDESWIWHRRMGHMHFDNLVKFNKREAVREMPQITKSTNTLCKHSQQGKKTKTRFKSKEYSTTRPLEIVHINLVGQTATKVMQEHHSNVIKHHLTNTLSVHSTEGERRIPLIFQILKM